MKPRNKIDSQPKPQEPCPHHCTQHDYLISCEVVRAALTDAVLRDEDGRLRQPGQRQLDAAQAAAVRRAACLIMCGSACAPAAPTAATASAPAAGTAVVADAGPLRRLSRASIMRALSFYWQQGRSSAPDVASEFVYVPVASGAQRASAGFADSAGTSAAVPVFGATQTDPADTVRVNGRGGRVPGWRAKGA